MSSLFGTSSAGSSSTPVVPAASLRVQTSLEGVVRPLVWGRTRIAGNLIWYGGFYAVAVAQNSGQQGGKGGIFGTSSPAAAPSSYNYFASVEIALCEGIAALTGYMWADKALTTMSAANLGAFAGTSSQAAWSYLTAQFPGQDYAYHNTCYVAGNVALGSSADLPNWTFEVQGAIANSVAGQPDADPTAVVHDFLTNANYGVAGWQASYNGDWTQAQAYTLASNLLISYALATATSASSLLQDLLTSLNIIVVWSDAVLKLVPRGDTQISGNGYAYFPPTSPLYDLDDSDFLPNQSGFGNTSADPVSGQRKPPRLQNNIIKVEFLDRGNSYNPAVTQAQDDGAILLYGERGSDSTNSWHWFQTLAAAGQAADLALGREQIANNYAVTLRPRYILLDPGDIVTITDIGLGLNRQWVRVLDVQENSDRSLNFLVEEYLEGTAAAPVYGRAVTSGSAPNYNADPGDINPPLIFEPTDELAGGLQIWAAISGINQTLYGGSDAYVSYDGVSYSRVPNGRQYGSARMGVLTSALAPVIISLSGQTIDITHNLFVDLTQSDGALASGTQMDALSLNTACYVDGEIISYQTAGLIAANKYGLSYLVRGAYGTEAKIVTHAAGATFVRLDDAMLRIPYDRTRIGATIYLKFLPFNVWGATVKGLADVAAHTYVITGSALASPLPNVQNLTTFYDQATGTTQIGFDEITDFRSDIRYEIKLGTTLNGALSLGTRAHPPFPSYGDGTYWIAAVCQPVAGLFVHSETWATLTISGSALVQNVIATRDEAASGWTGSVGGAVSLSGSILTTGGIGTGTYTIPPSRYIDAGRVAACRVAITWIGSALSSSSNILALIDTLGTPDFLGSGGTDFVDVHPEISFSQTYSIGDVFSLNPVSDPSNDIFVPADVFSPDGSFSPWQKYEPGIYVGRVFRARMVLTSYDGGTSAIALGFTFSVDVADRLDTWGLVGGVGTSLNQVTVPSTGLVIVFASNGKTVAEAFNGGPGTDPNPLIQITNTSASAFDFHVTAISKTGCTIVPLLAGTPTNAPNTNISIQGW